MNEPEITRTNLGGVSYAFLDAIVYNDVVYAVQKYISGAECRLVVFDRNKGHGMLSFDKKAYTVKSACATLTDAALAVYDGRLYVFWKHTGSKWQVWYRSYDESPDGKLKTTLVAYDTYKVVPDCHCYDYMDAVTFRKSLYLLMAVNRDNKNRIELRCNSNPVSSTGELLAPDNGHSFEEAVTFVSDGSQEITDIQNSDTDTWEAQTWINPDDPKDERLIVGRINNGTMTAYVWTGEGAWHNAAVFQLPDTGKYSSLKLVQAGPMTDGDTVNDAMYFIYTAPSKEIEMRRFLPKEARFDTGWACLTGTPKGWMGAVAMRNTYIVNEPSEPGSGKQPSVKTTEYQDEIHIISAKECDKNYDTMVKGPRWK